MALGLMTDIDRTAQAPAPGARVRVGVMQAVNVDPEDPEAPPTVVMDVCAIEVLAMPVEPPYYVPYFVVLDPRASDLRRDMDGPLNFGGEDFAAIRAECHRLLNAFLEHEVQAHGGTLMGAHKGGGRSQRLMEVEVVRVPLSDLLGGRRKKGKRRKG